MNLILASASPRRAALLDQAGISFTIIKPALKENPDFSKPPSEMVAALAREKALSVAETLQQGIVLAADTVVVYRGEVLGKPHDPEDARRMLVLLGGNTHEVFTGVTLIDAASGVGQNGVSVTKVWMKKMREKDIAAYVASGEPFDKAGSYGIQGKAALFVEKIEGCYFNVVGLPLSLLFDLMLRMQHYDI